MLKNKKRLITLSLSKGQSLFEVMIAMAIVSIVLISIVSLASLSIRATVFSRSQTEATRFTQQAIEWLQGEKSADWTTFEGYITSSNTYCLNSLTWTNPGVCSSAEIISGTIYTRQVTFTNNGDTTYTADVDTSWTDAQGVHTSSLSQVFGDIR